MCFNSEYTNFMPNNMLITENQAGHFFNQLTNKFYPSRNIDLNEAVLVGAVVAPHQASVPMSSV